MVKKKQKIVYFHGVLRAFRHPQMDPKRYTKAQKWTGCMAQCLSLKMSPHPNQQAHSYRRNGPKQPEISFSMLFGAFGHSQMDPKRYSKACNWTGCMANVLF
jgi:hypothetical protein